MSPTRVFISRPALKPVAAAKYETLAEFGCPRYVPELTQVLYTCQALSGFSCLSPRFSARSHPAGRTHRRALQRPAITNFGFPVNSSHSSPKATGRSNKATGGAGPAACCTQNHQAWHGHAPITSPVRNVFTFSGFPGPIIFTFFERSTRFAAVQL